MAHAYDTASAARSIGRRTTFRHAPKRCGIDEIGHGVLETTVHTAHAYDHVGYDYSRYADGDKTSDLAQSAHHRYEYGDGIVWKELRASLDRLHRLNISHVRVLDAGCGPGTWTRRIADYARDIGLGITVIGIDISTTQLEIARNEARAHESATSRNLAATIEFQACDLSQPLPWSDRHFDLVLCNYTVLNHLADEALPAAINELCRVASGDVIATLRAIGSSPTACIIGMEHVRQYRQDNDNGALTVTLDDESMHQVPFKMYTAKALSAMFSPHAYIHELRAIDIFSGRFAADGNWNAPLLRNLSERSLVLEQLAKLEEDLCRQPGWIDHGTHVLIVARPKHARPESNVRVLKAR